MLKRALRVILSKTFAFAVLIVLQIVFFCMLLYWLANYAALIYTPLTIVTALVLVAVLEQDDLNPAYKLMWILIIVLMPLFGTLFYVLWGHRTVPRRKRRVLQEIETRTSTAMTQDPKVIEQLELDDPCLGQSARYLLNHASSPLYPGGEGEYYPLGEDFFPRFLDTIRAAKKFIFMEYYIYEEGYMLDTTIEVLRQKAAEGVDVRVMWDGFGSLFTLPPDFKHKLDTYGIKCHPFSPITLSVHLSDYAMLNHRDHRKITVVDGVIGFSGGLNFADEYINLKERFGQWKDNSFMVRGEAVFTLTTTFLRLWDFASGTVSNLDDYRPAPDAPAPLSLERGYVQPYWDSPLDRENVSENAYLNVIRHAKDYVYICTPYLILDHEMITSLTLAAKSGVDVRILTPGIPDKPTVFLVTQSYYPVLLAGGVRIYEYTPGFNHAKMYVSDHRTAIIGSANMDYRSLYLHFENCVSFYGGQMVAEAHNDMLDCFDKAHEVTLEETRNIPFGRRLVQIVAKFFAPML
ncbi:cardiolipin synthase [Ruminococcaceae bacterium OttesenSCG-928-A11]|nr:cardiolipin synthase [Ruminococcaceae bacterium OttesenSCG-928-A11]